MKRALKDLIEKTKYPELWSFDGYHLVLKSSGAKIWIANGWLFLGNGTGWEWHLSYYERYRLWPHLRNLLHEISVNGKAI